MELMSTFPVAKKSDKAQVEQSLALENFYIFKLTLSFKCFRGQKNIHFISLLMITYSIFLEGKEFRSSQNITIILINPSSDQKVSKICVLLNERKMKIALFVFLIYDLTNDAYIYLFSQIMNIVELEIKKIILGPDVTIMLFDVQHL